MRKRDKINDIIKYSKMTIAFKSEVGHGWCAAKALSLQRLYISLLNVN